MIFFLSQPITQLLHLKVASAVPSRIRDSIGLLKQWVEQWKLLAYRGMEALVELFGRAPHPQEPHDVSAKVRGTHDTFLARCGLEASQA